MARLYGSLEGERRRAGRFWIVQDELIVYSKEESNSMMDGYAQLAPVLRMNLLDRDEDIFG